MNNIDLASLNAVQGFKIRVAGVVWEDGRQALAYDLMLETRESYE